MGAPFDWTFDQAFEGNVAGDPSETGLTQQGPTATLATEAGDGDLSHQSATTATIDQR